MFFRLLGLPFSWPLCKAVQNAHVLPWPAQSPGVENVSWPKANGARWIIMWIHFISVQASLSLRCIYKAHQSTSRSNKTQLIANVPGCRLVRKLRRNEGSTTAAQKQSTAEQLPKQRPTAWENTVQLSQLPPTNRHKQVQTRHTSCRFALYWCSLSRGKGIFQRRHTY